MLTSEKSVSPPASKRVIGFQIAAIVAACGVAWAVSKLLGEHDGWVDHKIYHAAIRWIYDGHDLYDYFRHPPHKEGFTYPPFAALVMLPMGLVTEWAAIRISMVMIGLTTVAITWHLVGPIADRRGWPRWVAVGIAAPLLAACGPVRETFEMGQVGWYLVGLVLIDVAALKAGKKWAGVGVGIAAAIKITPGFFVLYLLVTRQWRAAAVAAGAGIAATLAGALIGPATSWRFWTQTLWDTTRVGNMGSGRNSSVTGLLSHLTGEPGPPPKLLWYAAALAVLVFGLWRANKAHQGGHELAAFIIAGITCSLLSPISWGHHLVWVVPGIVLLVDEALADRAGVRRGPLYAAIAFYALYTSGAMHHANKYAGGHYWDGGILTQVGINSYALGCLALLALVPLGAPSDTTRADDLSTELAKLPEPQRA